MNLRGYCRCLVTYLRKLCIAGYCSPFNSRPYQWVPPIVVERLCLRLLPLPYYRCQSFAKCVSSALARFVRARRLQRKRRELRRNQWRSHRWGIQNRLRYPRYGLATCEGPFSEYWCIYSPSENDWHECDSIPVFKNFKKNIFSKSTECDWHGSNVLE